MPAELGGGGASHAQICELLRVMAHSCPSTALALSTHQHLVAAAVGRHLHGQPAEALLRRVAEAERVLVKHRGRRLAGINGQGRARRRWLPRDRREAVR